MQLRSGFGYFLWEDPHPNLGFIDGRSFDAGWLQDANEELFFIFSEKKPLKFRKFVWRVERSWKSKELGN